MKSNPVLARDIVAGDLIYWSNEWWSVKSNYCHPQSCYAKMGLTNDNFAREYGRNSTAATCKTIGKNDLVFRATEEAVSTEMITKCFEESQVLDAKLDELSNILTFPEDIKLGNSNVSVKRKVIEDICRAEIKASVSRLSNYCNKV